MWWRNPANVHLSGKDNFPFLRELIFGLRKPAIARTSKIRKKKDKEELEREREIGREKGTFRAHVCWRVFFMPLLIRAFPYIHYIEDLVSTH